LSDVLHRPRLARFIDAALRADLLDQLLSGTVWFEPTVAVTDCLDVADNKYLELALAAQAGIIVSSDQDLRDLHPWRGVLILRPAGGSVWMTPLAQNWHFVVSLPSD
jgi:uncharacterized protein